ncbi:MAG: fumarylacetoacetate hydrolase family protein [Bermanella sp.]
MGISVVRFQKSSEDLPCWGILEAEIVYELPWQESELEQVIEKLVPPFISIINSAKNTGLTMAQVRLLSPLTPNSQLLCQGLNYADHVAEAGIKSRRQGASENSLFLKSSASLTGAYENIIRPKECRLLDYEIELGLVIKKNITNAVTINQGELKNYVAGFIICNDVSSRDVQMGAPAMQWFQGKSYRSFCPAGPILYILDENEIDQLPQFQLKLWVNGELRQDACSSQLIHKPHTTLEHASRFSNMKAGDCLLTGTPGGVALEMNLKTGLSLILNMTKDAKRKEKFTRAQASNPHYLKDGDIVESQIISGDGSIHLGRQKNTVVTESL